MSQKWEASPKKQQELKLYTGSIEYLTEQHLKFFQDRYEIGPVTSLQFIQHNYYRYLLPLIGPNELHRGIVSRQPWIGSPISGRLPSPGIPKAITYMSALGPVQSLYLHTHDGLLARELVLVEDQLSAIKLYQEGFNAVALLGVPNGGNIGMDRVRELAQIPASEVIVALDEDATENAFEFVRKWGLAFKSRVRVAILDRDIKDTPLRHIPGVLGS